MATAETTRRLAAIHDNYLKGLSDSVLTENVILHLLKEKGRIKYNTGGENIRWSARVAVSTTTTGYNALAVVPQKIQANAQKAHVRWAGYLDGYFLPEWDLEGNKAAQSVFNLQKEELKSFEDDLATSMETDLFLDEGGDSDSDAFYGFDSFCKASGTYANIAMGTYAKWAGKVTAGNTFATNALKQVRLALVTSSFGSKKKSPTHMVCDKATWNVVHDKLQAYQQLVDPILAKGGFAHISYSGVPIAFNDSAPAAHLYVLNLNQLNLYVAHSKLVMGSLVVSSGDQLGMRGEAHSKSQLTASSPRYHGVIEDTDG